MGVLAHYAKAQHNGKFDSGSRKFANWLALTYKVR